MVNILLSLRLFNHPVVYKAVKPYVKENDKIAVLTYSFFKMFCETKESYEAYYEQDGPYFEKIATSFEVFGIDRKQILWIDYYKDSKEEAIKKLNEADIIYLPGGAPDEMMQRIIEKDLLDTLKSLDKTFIGVSAGTMIQFKDYYIAPDKEYPSFSEEKGLGLVDGFYAEVHFRRRNKQKKAIKKVWKKYHKDMYVIPDDGCIIVDDHKLTTYHTARKYYNQKGKIKR